MEVHTLSLNDFNRPRVLSKADAAYTAIIHLIYLEKGKFQSHPDMGVGIRSRYRFNNEDNVLDVLQQDIKKQIEKYLPELNAIEVSCEDISDGSIYIDINTDTGAVYGLEYDISNNVLRPIAEEDYLSRLKNKGGFKR